MVEEVKYCSKVYYQAVPAKHEVNLSGIAQAIEDALGVSGLGAARFQRIDALLRFLAGVARDVVVVIDEFTQWVRVEPRVAGELQYFINNHLPSTRMLLVIIGSAVEVMHGGARGRAPLYGRATAILRVKELRLRYLREFQPGFGGCGTLPQVRVVRWCASLPCIILGTSEYRGYPLGDVLLPCRTA